MKLYIALVVSLFFFTLSAFGQSESEFFSFTLKQGVVQDLYFNKYDKDLFSGDLYSENNAPISDNLYRKVEIDYCIFPFLSFGAGYGKGIAKGINTVEYYTNSFSELELIGKIRLSNKERVFNIEFEGGLSSLGYNSKRFMLSDNVLLNTIERNAVKWRLGINMTTRICKEIDFILCTGFNRVMDDGFDGWDYHAPSDEYIIKSLGIRFYIPTIKKIIIP